MCSIKTVNPLASTRAHRHAHVLDASARAAMWPATTATKANHPWKLRARVARSLFTENRYLYTRQVYYTTYCVSPVIRWCTGVCVCVCIYYISAVPSRMCCDIPRAVYVYHETLCVEQIRVRVRTSVNTGFVCVLDWMKIARAHQPERADSRNS